MEFFEDRIWNSLTVMIKFGTVKFLARGSQYRHSAIATFTKITETNRLISALPHFVLLILLLAERIINFF